MLEVHIVFSELLVTAELQLAARVVPHLGSLDLNSHSTITSTTLLIVLFATRKIALIAGLETRIAPILLGQKFNLHFGLRLPVEKLAEKGCTASMLP